MKIIQQTAISYRFWFMGCLIYSLGTIDICAQNIKFSPFNGTIQKQNTPFNLNPRSDESIKGFDLSGLPDDSLSGKPYNSLNNSFFNPDSIIYDPALFMLVMKQKMDNLPFIPNYSYGDYSDFKYKILHMKVEDPLAFLKQQINREKNRLPKNPLPGTKVDQFSPTAFGVTLGISPITAIYNLFSKDEHSRRMLAEVTHKEPLLRMAHAKYNKEIVTQITHLSGYLLDKFVIKYRPSDEYLISASEYDVIERIFMDFELFKKELAKEKTDSIMKVRKDSIRLIRLDSLRIKQMEPNIE
jgi:hypothetical protein